MNLKKIILINSANFNYLEVDMSKDLFFLGDNGSGKTTVIRAVHYLFSGDVRNLGIPTDKDGFKEYYFRYQNSYMIYVFEDFFIFMYKAGGEIVKLFSKQEFDKSRVIDAEGSLFELADIRKYAKEPNLKKTVKSLSEYRDIIYGHDSKYIDFKFTSIKNSEIFIGLFNEIFNIDKSIIDSKSIKKAIQTTLDYEKEVIDFNYDDYLQKIYEFQSKYKFFKEFERQKNSIEEAYLLKGELLELEVELLHQKEKLNYLSNKEEELLSDVLKRDSLILKEQDKVRENKKVKDKILNRCTDRVSTIINSLALDIEEISRLKEMYAKDNVLKNRDLADRYTEIKQSFDELSNSYAKLKSGFEDALGNIEKEIKSLEYKRDKELQREADDKESNQRRSLKDQLEADISKSELELNSFIQKTEYEISAKKDEIQVFDEKILESKKLQESIYTQLGESQRELKNQKDTDISSKEDAISVSEQDILKFESENKNISFSIENLKYKLNRDVKNTDEEYADENKRLVDEIAVYESMIHSNPGSFKEFLNEEVDGWEGEIFPIIDTKLLDMSVSDLSPSLVGSEKLFGLSLNKDKLKKILTKDEAEVEISALAHKQKIALEVYEEKLKELNKKYQNDVKEFELNIQLNTKEIELKQEEIKQYYQQIKDIEYEFMKTTQELRSTYEKEDAQAKKQTSKLQNSSQNSLNEIEDLNKSIYASRVEVKQNISALTLKYDKDLETTKEKITSWLKDERESLDAQIRLKEAKKFETTQSEQIQNLEAQLKVKHEELRLSDRAKEYLAEYSHVEIKIESYDKLVIQLDAIRFKNDEFKSRLNHKINGYDEIYKELSFEQKECSKNIKKYEKGLERFDEMEIDFDECSTRISDEFLDDVISVYEKTISTYTNKKINLKTMLDRINSLKNTQSEIDINFRLDELDSDFYISSSPNILTKIDEIVEFKDKKLEIVKENGHKEFVNFVNNLLPQKMSIFSDSEDKFFTQVARINKNLSKVDFGVIKDIQIDTKTTDKKSIAKILKDLEANVSNLSSLLNENSLFYDKKDVMDELNSLEDKFAMIKGELKGSAISLRDTLDLSLSFNENGKHVTQVAQLKNESSTGGSILLKIAIAISILKLFVKEDDTPFFLIVDEVSRLHSSNQERLREFANSKGFGIIFVTPEPTYSKPDHIKYYRFKKNVDDEFEAVELNI